MHLGLVLEMTHAGLGERTAITCGGTSVTHAGLAERSWAASARIADLGAPGVVYVGGNHLAYPIALFGAAGAGVPFVPLNFRLSGDQLAERLARHPGALVIHDGSAPVHSGPYGLPGRRVHTRAVKRQEFLDSLDTSAVEPPLPQDPELPGVLLYTSGTTAAPKAAILRHRHLMAYLLGTVEFGGSDAAEASLVSVPPYHIAGVANLVSNLYAGRRIVYLDQFDADTWLCTVRAEGVTQSMVVPTMLARVVAALEADDQSDAGTPTLRSLSYGGAPMPAPVLRRAMELFPTTDFVNAYGLTETSSTIALLGPDDHRSAYEAADPAQRARLGSVGRVLPGIDLEIRDDDGEPLPADRTGLIFVRGEQISGEYESERLLDEKGWFATRDQGHVDGEGYLFIEGRTDDTIIRGGENIAPAEIEEVLLEVDGIADAVVIGVPDDEWGQRLVAVVVPETARRPGGDEPLIGDPPTEESLRATVRRRLRSSKTPDVVLFWPELPRTETGKLLRRVVVDRLTSGPGRP